MNIQNKEFTLHAQPISAMTGRSQSELATYYGMEWVASPEMEEWPADFQLISFAECQRRGCVIGTSADTMFLLTANPTHLDAHQVYECILEQYCAQPVRRLLTSEEAFAKYLQGAESHLRAVDSVEIADTASTDNDTTGSTLVLSMAGIEATANPTVKLVDSTLYDALRVGASDIHFELQNKSLHIKYRLDGVLQDIRRVDSLEVANQVISRIKVLSDLDISERRIPQDGRFRVMLDQRDIDFRVSIMPNISAEDAVLRILDRKHLTGQFSTLSLDSLSFEPRVKSFIRRAAHLPYGLLLVTGPTGSGKTTTLYAAISEINTGLDKIITIEDPIEYQLQGVLQIPVNEKKGLTFAKGLRSTLRHDPDKIMVGEIRDSETAQIAVQAALTGHQVFTTVHANNVFDVIGRFSNMGVDAYSLVAALSGIMAQRLVRTVCPQCAVEVTASKEDLQALGLPEQQDKPISLKQTCGCDHCRGTGYKGRSAIAEILEIDDAMKDLLIQRAAISVVKTVAKERGFLSLRDSAIALALSGRTTIEEINRVTPVQ